MLKKDWTDLDETGQKGDWCFRDYEHTEENGETRGVANAYIVLRWGEGVNDVVVLPIAIPGSDANIHLHGKAAWEWDGNKDAPTLSPSILVHGPKDQPPLWHGYLRVGKLEE